MLYFLLVVSVVPRCSRVAEVLDATTPVGAASLMGAAFLDVLADILGRSYVSVAVLGLFFAIALGMAVGGEVGRARSQLHAHARGSAGASGHGPGAALPGDCVSIASMPGGAQGAASMDGPSQDGARGAARAGPSVLRLQVAWAQSRRQRPVPSLRLALRARVCSRLRRCSLRALVALACSCALRWATRQRTSRWQSHCCCCWSWASRRASSRCSQSAKALALG
jgi:hypothetical protein